MVLFDEHPTTLLRETTNQFHISPDRDSLTRISLSLTTLQQSRQSRLAQHHAQLKTLSRRLNSLSESHRWEEDRHDVSGHADRMLKMDTEKFRVAKGVSDAEIEVERLEGELGGLRVLEGRLEEEGVEGGRRGNVDGEDEVVLKLSFYRSLGISATQSPETGKFDRAVVRRAVPLDGGEGRHVSNADVNIIDIDANTSRSEYTATIWNAL